MDTRALETPLPQIAAAARGGAPLACPAWLGGAARERASRSAPLNKRRWPNFKANRRGYWSLVVFLACSCFTLFAEFLANDRPIVMSYKGEILWPVLVDYPESKFGGFLAVTDYKDPVILDEIAQNGWAIWPPIGYSYDTINKDYPGRKGLDGQCLGYPGAAALGLEARRCATRRPTQLARFQAIGNRNWLGLDDQGRDVVARVIYGFRISVLFGLILTVLSSRSSA